MRMDGVPDGEGGVTVRLARLFSRWRFGEVPEPLRIYSHHPSILRGFGLLQRAIEQGGAVSDRLKSLALHKTAQMVGCPF